MSRVTFADYAPAWIAGYRGRTSRGVGSVTVASYRRNLGLEEDGKPTGDGAVAFFGRMLLTEIGAPELRRFADSVASRAPVRGPARGLSRDTVRLALAPCKALLATAHEDGLIRSNPALGLRNLLPASSTLPGEVAKAMTGPELEALLGRLPGRWLPFFGFLAETGLRIGEAVEVRWQDLDLGSGWLSVERSFYRGKVGLPKGQRSRRVRLSDRMGRDLWALRKLSKASDDELVFVAEKGERVDQSNLMSRVLKPAAADAGLGVWIVDKRARGGRRAESWVGFHTFRHTCATVLFRSGWNAAQVCRHLGHSDPGFTLRQYVHLLDADVPEPNILDGLAGNGMSTRRALTGRDELAVLAVESA